MSKVIADLTTPLIRGLACAALKPSLRSLLFFDASIASLQATAQIMTLLLKTVTEEQVSTVQLGTIETEEDLWGSLTLSQDNTNQSFEWRSGLLSGEKNLELRIVVIPDLTRLSLAAARACVMLMGSEVGYLERHGHQKRWQPNLCWLAGCPREGVGLVSPHLLDRFALRFSEAEITTTDRSTQIEKWLQPQNFTPTQEDLSLSPHIKTILHKARSHFPGIIPEARSRILDYTAEGQSIRRDLTLLRLAYTNAQLDQAYQVTEQEIDQAAGMMGLKLLKQTTFEKPPKEDRLPPPKPPSIPTKSPLVEPSSSDSFKETPKLEPVYESKDREILPSTSLGIERVAIADPYPEDSTPVEREFASLRLPPRRFKSVGSGRGVIIGVEPTKTLQDLALVSTLLEAAKFQGFRRQAFKEQVSQSLPIPLILQSTDLRRYRRATVAEQMLTVVLDYTCLQDCRWQEALLPYLQWAYTERANICLIQVGSVEARQELQAEKIIAQNILVPRIRKGLEAGRGSATPLAHGLDLALQTLRHALQHGRSLIQQGVLVVISDGRGNIPLEASRLNQKPSLPVKQKGIEDAIFVSQQIAALNGVETVLLNPKPKYYANLPVKLAQALKAKIADILPLETWEVDE